MLKLTTIKALKDRHYGAAYFREIEGETQMNPHEWALLRAMAGTFGNAKITDAALMFIADAAAQKLITGYTSEIDNADGIITIHADLAIHEAQWLLTGGGEEMLAGDDDLSGGELLPSRLGCRGLDFRRRHPAHAPGSCAAAHLMYYFILGWLVGSAIGYLIAKIILAAFF